PGVRSARSDLAAIRGQIADQARRIVSSLGAQLQVARAHEADVKQQLVQARETAVKAQNTEAQLKELQADADSQRRVLQQLLIQAQQVVGPTGQAANNIPDVRLLSGAVPSDVPSAPNTKMAGGMGLAGGAVLGCLLAFIRGVRTFGFADADGLATIADISNVVTLPGTGRGALVKRVTEEPGGVEAEALRLLRARLRSLAYAPRNVVFTALTCDPAVIATAFARVAAMSGERVLLAEGALAKPGIGKLLGLRDGAFDRVLRGDEDWHDVVEADPDTPLDVLGSSEPASDQESLLASVALQNLLMEAREDYSMVVIAAAGDENAAVGTLAQRTDAMVLVVDGRRDNQAAVRELAQHLTALSRSPVLGLLVTPA
ncbi:MAG TPA: hypothetical protein VHX39_03300, partial [Acetobacteraceae bacterium]|nr:hypothetical protein [Acetobacteraceae bacterium]